MKKRLLCMILTLVMIFSLVPSAAAASNEATEAAETLYELGLFKGTGTNPDGTPIFDLDKTPTRNQAIIMLVRLLGKEDEAKAGTWDIPFTDVSDTMRPYIGYAYTNGLTNGTTATTYSGGNPIKANQYITFVLRALGYESGKDFEVSSAWTLSDELGITAGQYHTGINRFCRGDVAVISNAALSVFIKGTSQTLKDRLFAEGVIRAWHEVDALGNLYLKTSLHANPKKGYSLLIKRYQRSGCFDHDSQGRIWSNSVQYEYTSALSYMGDGGDIVQTELYVFDAADTAQKFFAEWREASSEKDVLDAVSQHLIAKFVLNDTIILQQTTEQFDVTDFLITYDEAAQEETYMARISAPIAKEGMYGLVYQGKSGAQNASLSYIGRIDDHLGYTREINHFGTSGSSGIFYVSHCTHSQVDQDTFLCKAAFSSGFSYQFPTR